jgi:hypothetical protein
MGDLRQPDHDRISELADAIASLSARVDALWQLISAVVESAGLAVPNPAVASSTVPSPAPPPDFVQALAAARKTGRREVRLSIDGREWVAALSRQPPEPDPASWSAIERLARGAEDQDEM